MQEDKAAEIEALRTRISDIEEERADVPEDDPGREELLQEEKRLEVRLAELEEQIATEPGEAAEKAASQTDLTTTPKLPEDDEEH